MLFGCWDLLRFKVSGEVLLQAQVLSSFAAPRKVSSLSSVFRFNVAYCVHSIFVFSYEFSKSKFEF